MNDEVQSSGPAKLTFTQRDGHIPVWARQFEANKRAYEREMNQPETASDVPEGLEDLARVMKLVNRR